MDDMLNIEKDEYVEFCSSSDYAQPEYAIEELLAQMHQENNEYIDKMQQEGLPQQAANVVKTVNDRVYEDSTKNPSQFYPDSKDLSNDINDTSKKALKSINDELKKSYSNKNFLTKSIDAFLKPFKFIATKYLECKLAYYHEHYNKSDRICKRIEAAAYKREKKQIETHKHNIKSLDLYAYKNYYTMLEERQYVHNDLKRLEYEKQIMKTQHALDNILGKKTPKTIEEQFNDVEKYMEMQVTKTQPEDMVVSNTTNDLENTTIDEPERIIDAMESTKYVPSVELENEKLKDIAYNLRPGVLFLSERIPEVSLEDFASLGVQRLKEICIAIEGIEQNNKDNKVYKAEILKEIEEKKAENIKKIEPKQPQHIVYSRTTDVIEYEVLKEQQKAINKNSVNNQLSSDLNSSQQGIDMDGDGTIDFYQIVNNDDEEITDVRDCDPTTAVKEQTKDDSERTLASEKSRVQSEYKNAHIDDDPQPAYKKRNNRSVDNDERERTHPIYN